jgi:hypothetical protein
MTKPRSADEFLDLLLSVGEVVSACKEELGERAVDVMSRAKEGDSTDFLDWFEEWRMSNTENVAEEVEGAAPYDDTFAIEIIKAGPVLWIRANEFDDICYFDSLSDARLCVYEEFEGFINELAERRREENEEG